MCSAKTKTAAFQLMRSSEQQVLWIHTSMFHVFSRFNSLLISNIRTFQALEWNWECFSFQIYSSKTLKCAKPNNPGGIVTNYSQIILFKFGTFFAYPFSKLGKAGLFSRQLTKLFLNKYCPESWYVTVAINVSCNRNNKCNLCCKCKLHWRAIKTAVYHEGVSYWRSKCNLHTLNCAIDCKSSNLSFGKSQSLPRQDIRWKMQCNFKFKNILVVSEKANLFS